ncbi:MAG: MIP/aquaporin family protein [Acidobacteriota bacterium]
MRTPRAFFVSEFVGTALLVAVGVSLVILAFGRGSPVVGFLPSAGLRRLLAGFLFGTTGALIAISPVGKISGAHINPVVTFAFWLKGKMGLGHALGYAAAQLAGAVAGALPLLAWGGMGASIDFGATLPGPGYGAGAALIGEVTTTIGLIVGLFFFLGHQRLRRFTPLLFPLLYAVMVYLEAPVSGTSTNPARTLGPAVIAGAWRGWWVYWLGPVLGALIGVGVHTFSWLSRFEVKIAKVYHFDHDPHGIFRRHAPPSSAAGEGSAHA